MLSTSLIWDSYTTFPTFNILLQSGTFVTINDPILTYCYHPKSLVYIKDLRKLSLKMPMTYRNLVKFSFVNKWRHLSFLPT
ncbi:unnamed protein product [Nyctereutes procyonoides]|uniref:(raccoon dog) hypothetical protein n=1 Tax=Nyctereutes procyonoides TaxID=34880 RepID=A0A811ZCS2_NYCPR|nr:unnamed protein product [Nyctereutes procyonoides]